MSLGTGSVLGGVSGGDGARNVARGRACALFQNCLPAPGSLAELCLLRIPTHQWLQVTGSLFYTVQLGQYIPVSCSK